jgi:hypothetical protein
MTRGVRALTALGAQLRDRSNRDARVMQVPPLLSARTSSNAGPGKHSGPSEPVEKLDLNLELGRT